MREGTTRWVGAPLAGQIRMDELTQQPFRDRSSDLRWTCVPRRMGGYLILLLLVWCAPPPVVEAIVRRDDVVDADYTAEAALESYGAAGVLQGGSLLCTGTLIHPEWVLTAAHCIPSPSANDFRFSLGSSTTELELTVAADSWLKHPSYDGSNLGQGVDFGLIHLSQPILDVTPAQLYRGSSEQFKDATILGYGRTGTGITGGTGSSGVKRAAENHVDKLGNASGWSTKTLLTDFDTPHSTSPNPYGSSTPLDLEGAVDSGDSGGPWFQTINGTHYLTAITSYKFAFDASTNADYGDGSAASRVGQELVWLDGNHDISRFWQGGSSTWDDASQWTDNTSPGAANAAVIDSGTAVINSAGATAEYLFVEGSGTLGLADSLTTSYLLLDDGGRILLAAQGSGAAVNGNYRQSGGTIDLDITGGASGTEFEQLAVTGSAEIAGTLAVSLDSGNYQDPLSRGDFDPFALLTADTLSGQFDQVDYDGQMLAVGPNYVGANGEETDGLFRILTYDDSTVAVINYLAVEGDINGDMQVDDLDFNIWNQNRFSTNTDWARGDLNGDSVTDGLDFHIWSQHRATTIPNLPSALAVAAVPEPATLSAGLLACLLVMLSRRRRPT